MTEFIITCQSELQKDGSYKIERYRELVRCKDCKHHGEWSCAVCIDELFETADNWYCADGVRKDESTD